MKVAIHGRDFQQRSPAFLKEILGFFEQFGAEVIISEKFARWFKGDTEYKHFSEPRHLKGVDYFVSLGGDGTLLDSITFIGKREIPILGVNTGRLGFLATVSREEAAQAIEALCKGKVKTSARTLLQLHASPNVFGEMNVALNDFTIMKRDSSMIRVEVLVNGELLSAYWADGLIVATPTGSTGYSLSCGGPLVHPKSGCVVITPVSPHNLTMRPMVLPDSVELEFRVESRSKKFQVSLDSRFETIDGQVSLKLTRAPFRVKLVQLPHHHYFDTLRQKLNWGLDIRN